MIFLFFWLREPRRSRFAARETRACKGQRPGRACFPSLLHKPSASANPGEGRALSCFAASAALRSAFAAPGTYGFQRPTLLATPCFPSQLREPARLACGPAFVSLRLLRNRYAFPCLSPGRPRPSRLFAGEPPAASRLGAAEPCRLARTSPRSASVSAGILFVIPAKAGIHRVRIDSVCPACKVGECPLFVIPAKAGIQKNNVTFVFRLLINPLGANPLLQCLQ